MFPVTRNWKYPSTNNHNRSYNRSFLLTKFHPC